MRRIRWSDNDRRFGPITAAWAREFQFGVVIESSDDEGDPGYARMHVWRLTVLWPIPAWLIRPHREKRPARYWDAETIKRMGRDWYWDVHKRKVGFVINDGALHYYYGKQTNEWPGCKSGVWFLPWTQWRHVRHSFYDMDGDLFAHVPDRDWDARQKLETACPALRFDFLDFDGEQITAKTRIEEHEWRFGTGWWKWLSLFRRPKISRSLDLEFSAETGPRKGSWKGGTVGHSIEMLPGELHEAAFRRYCAEHRMTFVSAHGEKA